MAHAHTKKCLSYNKVTTSYIERHLIEFSSLEDEKCTLDRQVVQDFCQYPNFGIPGKNLDYRISLFGVAIFVTRVLHRSG